MKRLKEEWRRPIALLLAFVMIMSTMNSAWAVRASAAEHSVTVGELFANNYLKDFSAEELAVLNSGLLTGDSYTYEVPSDKDGLVDVDPEAKTIKAQSFTTGSLVWEPSSAAVVYAGGEEPVELTGGEGSFEYEGKAYSVKVEYALHIQVSTEAQAQVAAAPFNLAKGLENLNKLKDQKELLDIMSQKIDTLADMYSNGVDVYYQGMPLGHVDLNEKARDALLAMQAECKANGGTLQLVSDMDAYTAAASKTQFLIERGEDTKAHAVATYNNLSVFWTYGDIRMILMYIKDSPVYGAEYSELSKAADLLEASIKVMKSVVDETEGDPWTAASEKPVKAGITDGEYTRLDSLIQSLMTKDEGGIVDVVDTTKCSDHAGMELRTKLVADSATISCQVARNVVTVEVKAFVADPTEADPAVLKELTTHRAVLELDSGVAMSEVVAAITDNGVEVRALGSWNAIDPDYNIGETCYDRSVPSVSGSLTEDMTYEIVYTPKYYTVTYGFTTDLPVSVPYGYCLTLPSHSDGTKEYVYQIGGQKYFQGDVYRVTGAVSITRSEEKYSEGHKLSKLVARVYGADITAEEKAILEAAALKIASVRLRTPSDLDELLTLDSTDLNTYHLTAKNFNSAYGDLLWVPAEAVVVRSDKTEADPMPITGGELDFTAEDVSSVYVVYKLDLADITRDQIQELLDLPGTLSGEAKTQLDNMNFLANYHDDLGKVNNSLLGVLKNVVADWDVETRLAVQELLDNSVVTEEGPYKNKLKLYAYVDSYMTKSNAAKLAYYYQDGYSELNEQLQLLKRCLPIVVNDPHYESLYEDFADYKSQLEALPAMVDKLDGVEFVAPNAVIDRYSTELMNLADALVKAIGHTGSTKADKDLVLEEKLTVAAPDRVLVKFTVQVKNGSGDVVKTVSKSVSYETNTVLTEDELNSLLGTIESMETELGVDKKHYVSTSDVDLAVGTVLSATQQFTVEWAPAVYTVTIEADGAVVSTQTFPFDNPVITLPACTENGKIYLYSIGGAEVLASDAYRFETEQIDKLFKDNAYTIVRKVENVNRGKLESLVSSLNSAIVEAELLDSRNCQIIAFMLKETVGGDYVIVMRVSPQRMTVNSKLMTGLASAITSVNEILVDGELLWNGGVYLQSVVNAILRSGFGLDTITSIINENGDLKELKLEGLLPTPKAASHVNDPDILGAKLMQSELEIDGIKADFYVTMEDFDLRADQLKTLRDMAGKVLNKGNIKLSGGKLNVSVHDLPEKVYELYLLAMLITGHADLADLGGLDHELCIQYVAELLAPFVTESSQKITLAAVKNTTAKIGKTVDLSRYENYFNFAYDLLCGIIGNSDFTDLKQIGDKSFGTEMTYHIRDLLKEQLGSDKNALLDLIEEAKEGNGLRIPMTFTYDLAPEDYQAMIVDYQAPGLSKLRFSKNLPADMAGVHNRTIVVLLSNVTGDVSFPSSGFLDLNGKTINGSLNCGGNVVVLDSTLSTTGSGKVTGAVTGNAKLTAGHYSEGGISAKLASNYVLDGDLVRNPYYTMETDDSGNITVTVTADVNTLRGVNRDAAISLAMDLGVDLALNYFVCESLNLGGHEIYNFQVDSVMGLLDGLNADKINELIDCVSCAGITDFANELLAAFTDLEAVANAIENGTTLIEFSLTANAWNVELNKVGSDGNEYIDVSILPGDVVRSQTLKVLVDSTDGPRAAKVLKDTAKIVEMNATVELSDINYNNKTVTATGAAHADVEITMKQDPSYAVVCATLIADANTGAIRTTLVDAIKSYYATKNIGALKSGIESASMYEFVKGLSNMSTSRSYAAMLSSLGLSSVVPSEVVELENEYHKILVAIGKGLAKVGEKGNPTHVGDYEVAGQYGTYAMDRAFSRSFTRNVYGAYGVGINVTEAVGKVVINMFAESLVKVTAENGDILYLGESLDAGFAAAEAGSTVEILGDVALENDTEIGVALTIVGADKITWNDSKIVLTSTDASVTSDVKLDNVTTNVEDYEVEETGSYTYKLKAIIYPVVVTAENGDVLYKGDSLTAAFAAVTNNSTVTVNSPVTADADVNVAVNVTIVGAEKIDWNGNKIVLTSTDASVTSDVKLDNVTTNVEDYEVEETGSYTYKLKAIIYPVVVTAENGDVLYKGNSLDEGLAAAANKSTVTVNAGVTLGANTNIDCEITIVGASNITWGNWWSSRSLILTGLASKVTADVDLSSHINAANTDNYRIDNSESDPDAGKYVYKLAANKIVMKTNSGRLLYGGSSLKDAFAAAPGSGSLITMTILDNVTLEEDVTLGKSMNIVNADKIDWNGKTVTLTDANVTLTAAAKVPAVSGVEGYEVVETYDDATGIYTYTLQEIVVTYAIVVTDKDGNVIYQGSSLDDAFAAATESSTITVNSEVTLNGDVDLDHNITIVGASNINWNGKKVTLTGTDASLTSDVKLTNVTTNVEDYEVEETGSYTYKLKAIVYAVVVTSAAGTNLYKGDSLTDAFAKATAGSTVTVNSAVTASADVALVNTVTLKGASKINWNGKKLTLAGTNVTLTSDAKLTNVVSGVEDYEVEETGSYTYKLKAIVYAVVVTSANGTNLYKGDSLTDALAKANANAGSTVTVNSAVTASADVTLVNTVTLKGASKINWNGKKLTLAGTNVTLTSDAKLTNVVSGVEDFEIEETGSYIYKLKAIVYAVVVTDGSGKVVYKGNSLDDAIKAANNGSGIMTITVNSAVKLAADQYIAKNITITGASKIDWNGKKLTLAGASASLTSDAKLTNVVSGIEGYEVEETGRYTYKLKAIADPEITGAPTVDTKTDIRGAKVDADQKIIFLDVHPDGITLDQLKAQISFPTENADTVELSIEGTASYQNRDLICNGAKLTAVASNSKSSKTATVTYTVIIMGDTNSNGRTDSGDAVLMTRHYQDIALMTGNALLAADMNQNDRVDSGDAVKNCTKFTQWDQNEYVSMLK